MQINNLIKARLSTGIYTFFKSLLSPLITEVENIFGDPWLFPVAFLPKYLTGCISHCCIVGGNHGVHVHVRRDLKKKRYEAEGAKEYREANRRIQKAVKKAKEDWIGAQCEEIETCLNKNNSKRAYQLVKDLTSEKQGRSSTIQDKSGKCLTEEKEILSRWTEYCSELYNYESCGDNTVLDCSQPRKKICNQSSVRKLRLQ